MSTEQASSPRPAAAEVVPPDRATPVLELRGISKLFPGVRALDDVSFTIRAGEVHMLLGENGAGKSSLIKVLYGAYPSGSGEILHHGTRVTIASPADARRLGVAVIFQEFSLVPFLDIAQNIFLGREFAKTASDFASPSPATDRTASRLSPRR